MQHLHESTLYLSLSTTNMLVQSALCAHSSCAPLIQGGFAIPHVQSWSVMQKTVYYWTQDTTEVCFTHNHFWTALLLGVPGVLIVCLGIPIWFAGVLYRGRHDLNNLSLQRTYGFLYQGYK